MNTVLLELNSYIQSVRFLLNGNEPSKYSELNNYKYKQIIDKPELALNAIARELNDDFNLQVTATGYIYNKIAAVAKTNEYCLGCVRVQPKLNLSTSERFERLAKIMPASCYTILVTNSGIVPETLKYGNVVFSFTVDSDADYDFQINFIDGNIIPPSGKGYVNIAVANKEITTDFIVSVCETYFINSLVGKIIDGCENITPEIQLNGRLQPIVTAVISDAITVGETEVVSVRCLPEDSVAPEVVITSSNADILAISGLKVTAVSSGEVEIKAFIKGETNPFMTQVVKAEKKVYASSIEIHDFETILYPGDLVTVKYTAFPEDSLDIGNMEFISSDTDIAETGGYLLRLKKPGEFTLTIRGEKTETSKTFKVEKKIESLSLSVNEVSVNVGGKVPISVSPLPEDAYYTGHKWISNDETVAVVVEENGQEFVKAVGIGECEISCIAEKAIASCKVTVNSALYQKKGFGYYKKYLIGVLLLVVLLFVKGFISDTTAKIETQKEAEELARLERERIAQQEALYNSATRIDVFEEMEYSITGVNGEGVLVITKNSANPLLQAGLFTASKEQYLSNGENITITFTIDDLMVEKYGYAPLETEKVIIVSGLSSYIEDSQQIPSEFIEAAKQAQMDWWLKEQEKYQYAESTVECCGVFYWDRPDSETHENNMIIVLHGVNTSYLNSGKAMTNECYIAREYNNLGIDESGNITNRHEDAIDFLGGYNTLQEITDKIYSRGETRGYITVQIQ